MIYIFKSTRTSNPLGSINARKVAIHFSDDTSCAIPSSGLYIQCCDQGYLLQQGTNKNDNML